MVVVVHRFTAALTVAAVLAAVLAAAACPARADGPYVAPGRVLVPRPAPVPEANVDAGGADAGVVLPDGGSVLVGTAPRGILAVALRADGSTDAGFGTGGTAQIDLGSRFTVLQLLRQDDGRLLVSGTFASAASTTSLPGLVLVRLLPDGRRDASFGTNGVQATGIQGSCGSCEPVALQPDGRIVAAGNIGTAAPGESPATALSHFHGVVTRLNADGAVDTSFAGDGIAELDRATGVNAGGYGAAVTPTGAIVVLARGADGMLLTRLTPAGEADPAFHGGAPQLPPVPYAFTMLVHPEGPIDVSEGGRIVRYTAAGEPDPSFGKSGVVELDGEGVFAAPPRMLAGPEASTLLARAGSFEPHLVTDPSLVLRRVLRTGEAQAVASVRSGFGGGYASPGRSTRLVLGGVEQDSFLPTRVLRRPGGGLLAIGAVRIIRYTGEGAGFSRGFFATQAYTATGEPDTTYGGPTAGLRVHVVTPRQKPRYAVHARRIAVRVTSSAPGLVLVRVRDGRRRVLAQSVVPVYRAGTVSARIPLTPLGRRALATPRIRVLTGWQLRDVLGTTVQGATATVLR